ncbi:hypothetical protein WA026_007024 [Henosepilachna vigintioctopunctata]|uniref:Uncharacterized protein n=1 Tax=Henosepilachna vigintioctopunctata TaxID=420089 RepID=A0AAW1V896_9CUCU
MALKQSHKTARNFTSLKEVVFRVYRFYKVSSLDLLQIGSAARSSGYFNSAILGCLALVCASGDPVRMAPGVGVDANVSLFAEKRFENGPRDDEDTGRIMRSLSRKIWGHIFS